MTFYQTLSQWLSDRATPLPASSSFDWLQELHTRTWNATELPVSQCKVSRDEDGHQANVDIPETCLIMTGIGTEFRRFKVKDAFVRTEYIELVNRLIKFVESSDMDDEDSEDSEDLDAANTLTQTCMLDNPFSRMHGGSAKTMIVTGSPGNGKSMLLHFILRLLLHAGIPVLLQVKQDSAILVSEHGVHYIATGNGQGAQALGMLIPNMWCLVDSTTDLPIPSAFVRETGCHIVQTPSPRIERMDWRKKIMAPCDMFCIAPFSLQEAIVVRQFQTSDKRPTERQLEFWYERYTPSLRPALLYAKKPQKYAFQLERELDGVADATGLVQLAHAVTGSDTPQGRQTPHEIFVYFPRQDREFTSAEVRIPTFHLISTILRHFQKETAVERLRLYHTWIGIAPLAGLTGLLLEHLVKQQLLKGGHFPLQKLHVEEKSVNQHWTVSCDASTPPDCHLIVDGKDISFRTTGPQSCKPALSKYYNDLQTDVHNDGAFYFPRSPNEPTFDFLHVHGSTMVLFQSTASRSHDIKAVGLHNLSSLLSKFGIQELVYVAVVPTERENPWKEPDDDAWKFIINKDVAKQFSFTGRYLLQFKASA